MSVAKLVTAVASIAIILNACGPSEATKARRAEAAQKRQAAAQERERKIAQFAQRAEQRLSAGELGPDRIADPGYPIAYCAEPSVASESGAVSISVPSIFSASTLAALGGASSVVCDNTSGGKKAIAWREWYCEGDRDCVLSKWARNDGDNKSEIPIVPTLKGMITTNFTHNLGGTVVNFQPSEWGQQ